MPRMMTSIVLTTLCLLVGSSHASAQTPVTAKATNVPAQPTITETDRLRDGLIGPVRRVRTEVAKLSSLDGRSVESKHVVLEIVAYDLRGNKVENQYFPIAGATLTGKEVYKYDEKGNISEMTLLNADGSLVSREVYKYEFDFAGNWNKMTTSVAVIVGGQLTFEPTEVTYRSIMYYLNENMVKMVTSKAAAATQTPANPAPANNLSAGNVAPESRSNTKDNKSAPPALPSASTSANSLESSEPEVKTLVANDNQGIQRITLDSEPPFPGPKPILKPISGGVLNGTAISLPAPVYPDVAKRMRTSGVVEVDVVLDESGRVVSAVAKSGPPILRDAAVKAALRARFSPTKLSGQPVKVSGIINYKFALSP